jgi:hypothetical protein
MLRSKYYVSKVELRDQGMRDVTLTQSSRIDFLSGTICVRISFPPTTKQFEVGKTFYVYFVPAAHPCHKCGEEIDMPDLLG